MLLPTFLLAVSSPALATRFMASDRRLVRFGPGPNETALVPALTLDLLHSVRHGHDGEAATLDLEHPLLAGLHPGLLAAVTDTTRRGPGWIDMTEPTLPAINEASPLQLAVQSEELEVERRQTATFPTPNAAKYPQLSNDGFFKSVSATKLSSTVATLSNYTTRYYRNTNARVPATWIQSQFTAAAGSGNVVLVENSFDQPNVIAQIPRKAGSTNDEIVVIGAHLDSINQSSSGGRAPGADDDASGIAVLLQTLQILTENGWAGSRQIEFHAYAGEEGGLLGSSRVASQYKSAGINVRGMLQFDMIAYQINTKPVITILTDTSSGLQTFSNGLITTYIPEATLYTNRCGYACSDHFSWDSRGYASISIDESGPSDRYLNPYYHTSGDTIDRLDFTKASVFVKLALAWALELSE
ncbi:Zn-dependent exopeptidase [Auricularia subglabra TFB-10046 SS5]|uniref:Peptide hydrolase n=1 Tax=Auricularia subglabra (strain TFB-10046 / SS5) TaxID=717982 RepID=J0D2H3_AURST|nr:Zn-dependent exopeptidase [Auricularia subglabra TFB-10046 SS5]